ncbi:G/U mismatch-specific DNA glycosylase [Neobacillus sp. LXY-4]|uniref:G/U mismatch-specific DNA glycosylase n=1 Tax=Neobacillus sp. LXY-4 TaxID=3379826 RepID=UPI003EE3FCCA
MKPIEDHIKEDLAVLFVGFNPSIRSSETGHHFANPNNRFWTILHKAGITPKKFTTEEDRLLLDYGFGFTNIVQRPTKAAQEISKEEYKLGQKELKRKITRYKPRIVCFVGKGVYQEYSGKKDVPWGVQPESVVEGTLDFVAPSSSGLVRMKIEDIIRIYAELPNLIKH